MPPVSWPSAPATVVAAFESRHSDPEAGALLHWAFSSVDALHYMSDLDAAYDQNRVVPGGHIPDVVDVAHARWATGTSITALDLAAAGLARALGGHPGPRELDFGDFASPKPGKAVATVVNAMPAAAMTWIRNVLTDAAFVEVKDVRDALTHRRLPRHLHASLGSPAPNQRLALQVGAQRLPVRSVIENARDLATRHLVSLLTMLPTL